MAHCPKCGSVLLAGITSCTTCGIIIPGQSSFYKGQPIYGSTTVAWETPAVYGVLIALKHTIATVLFNPSQIFSQIQRGGNLFLAWAYAIIVGSTGLVCNFLWSRTLAPVALDAMENIGVSFADGISSGSIKLVIAPLLVSTNIVLLSLYCQIILRLFSRTKRPFSDLFRTVCYAQTPAILQVIPFIGAAIAMFWSLYLVVAGAASLYRLGRLRTLALFLFPLVIVSIALIIIVVTIAGAGLMLNGILKEVLQSLR